MAYPRPHVRQAIASAREAGKPVEGMFADDRETVITLERWGFLPVDQDAVDRRIADWYVAQGLAIREGDTPDTPDPVPVGVSRDTPGRDDVALEAAEAALAASSAALRLARSMAS